MGSLQLILGGMFSFKSTNLLREYNKLKLSRKKCLLVKFTGDNRYTDKSYIATHDGVLSSDEAISCMNLIELKDKVNLAEYDAICIDEIQFYGDNLEMCIKWRKAGKIVIACGLYADFKRKPFKNIPELIGYADKVTFVQSICMDCGEDKGMTSFRTTLEQDQVVIGGNDKYIALCQSCYDNRISA
jgi:thymidine kinase